MVIAIAPMVTLARLPSSFTPRDPCTDEYLQMIDSQLFEFRSGNTIGEFCYVQDLAGEGNSDLCNYYVLAQPSTSTRYSGWPRTPLRDGDRGTGCVKDDSSSFCFYYHAAYNLTQPERDSFCTNSPISNAASQLRHAIRNGACGELQCSHRTESELD